MMIITFVSICFIENIFRAFKQAHKKKQKKQKNRKKKERENEKREEIKEMFKKMDEDEDLENNINEMELRELVKEHPEWELGIDPPLKKIRDRIDVEINKILKELDNVFGENE